jgi:hypothetical protein
LLLLSSRNRSLHQWMLVALVSIRCQDTPIGPASTSGKPCDHARPARLMRRTPFACHRAVQSLQLPSTQSIWVSDELLSSTLDHFFRISCPHQKRHGSHVPGPLEARRRAAKRRMTLSANLYPQETSSSYFNFGALFGLRTETQPSWKYEPPSLRKDPEPLASCTFAMILCGF